jgi:hypothetical protein
MSSLSELAKDRKAGLSSRCRQCDHKNCTGLRPRRHGMPAPKCTCDCHKKKEKA